jgi:hypothetical protein
MNITNLLKVSALALAATALSHAATFNFASGNGTLTGGNNYGNSLAVGPVSGVTVTVTAFGNSSSNSTGAFSTAAVAQYSGGLGVKNQNEGTNVGQPNHATDNYGSVDYLRFTFSSSVTLSAVSFGWYQTDDDFKYWIGNNLTSGSLSSGGTSVDGTGANSYGISGIGNTLWLAAQPNTADWGHSYFKLKSLTFTVTPPPTTTVPDAGSTLILLGLGLLGLAGVKRRMAA